MKYVVTAFFDYGYGNNDLLWKFFLLHAAKWIKYVDRVFVIDSGCGLEIPMSFPLILDKMTIVKKPAQSHWQNMNEALAPFTNADHVLLLDSDMIIYDSWIVKFGFEQLEKNIDIVSILDSSGGVSLKQYSIMQENEKRFERRRLCPYLCFLKKSVLRPNFDFTPIGNPNWTDSMGKITQEVLEDGKIIFELQDDRSTISLEDDGKITSCQWLDTPPKKWALEENPNLGYYHIRNFGGGLRLLKEKELNGVPSREAKRLLAWVYWLARKVDNKKVIADCIDVFDKLAPYDGMNYAYKKFGEYHKWLENI